MSKCNKTLFLLPLFFSLSFKTTERAQGTPHDWGFFGHKKINELAIYGLPDEMFSFYKQNLDYLIEHSVDPDKRRYAVKNEAACHYIDLDHYYNDQNVPYRLPLFWRDAICQFEEDSLYAHGIVPWHVQKKLYQLTDAFLSKNKNRILQISAELGHYIGDAHVPLHTCSNYNGQKTGQRGIHGLWESRLPELNFDHYVFYPHKAQLLEHPEQQIWNAIYDSHSAVDSVLRMEKKLQTDIPLSKQRTFESRGSTEVSTYSTLYSNAYHTRLNGQVERRMRKAIACITDFWYTAWVNAGQPKLTNLNHQKWKSDEVISPPAQVRDHEP
jgi:hypothetical protein